jgi:hypothetical protein
VHGAVEMNALLRGRQKIIALAVLKHVCLDGVFLVEKRYRNHQQIHLLFFSFPWSRRKAPAPAAIATRMQKRPARRACGSICSYTAFHLRFRSNLWNGQLKAVSADSLFVIILIANQCYYTSKQY